MKTKLLFRIILCFSLLFMNAQPARADYWAAVNVEGTINRALVWMKDNVDGIILGVAKSALAAVMNTQIADLLGGGNGGRPQFVTNWTAFLVADTSMRASVYMEDFLTYTFRGRGSSDYDPYDVVICDDPTSDYRCAPTTAMSSDYSAMQSRYAWLAKEGVVAGEWTITPNTKQKCAGNGCLASQNYYAYLRDVGEQTIENSNWEIIPGKTRKISGGVSDIDQAFSEWRDFSSVFADDMNNAFGVAATTAELYAQKKADEQLIAMTEAISGNGYLSVKDANGMVKTPGITIGDVYNSVKDFNLKNIASAEKISEVVIAAATNYATNYVVNLATEGLNKASRETGIDMKSLANTAWNSYNNDDDGNYDDVVICDPGMKDPDPRCKGA